MAIRADILSDLIDDDKADFFQYLDATMNSGILCALLHGIYTGILAVTLWNIFINKCWPIRRAMVIFIILLHVLITISFTANWSFIHSAFVDNGQTSWTVYLKLTGMGQAASLEVGIAASISTILADLYMAPSKIVEIYHNYFTTPNEVFQTFYISFALATTLWCTVFIIYRILAIAGVKCGTGGRLGVYQHFIEALVESSAFYSISLTLYLAFNIRNSFGLYYLDALAAIAKGIAPTLLVGRITAGHRARPDDSWQGSVIASVSIRPQEQERSQTSSQEDRPTSVILDGDLEAQRESGVRESSPTFFPGPGAQSQGLMTSPKFENFPLYYLGDTEGSIKASVAWVEA